MLERLLIKSFRRSGRLLLRPPFDHYPALSIEITTVREKYKPELQAYYEYEPSQGGQWWKKTPPPRNTRFEEALLKLGGTNEFGEPVLRVVWGGTAMSEISAQPRKKYGVLWEGVTHHYYLDAGKAVKIHDPHLTPKDKIALPGFERLDLGRLRWVVEKWSSAEEVRKLGRCDQRILDDDGKPLFRTVPSKGVYDAFFVIQSLDGKFRDLDMQIFDAVAAMWRYHERTSLSQKFADIDADMAAAAKRGGEEASNIWMS